MPKKKDPPENPEDQFRRFLDVVKEKGVDADRANRRFKKLVPKPEKKPQAQ